MNLRGERIPDTPSWKTDYEKNLLAGMWSEVFYRSRGAEKADTFNISKSSSAFFEEDMQAFTNLYLTSNTNEQNTLSGNTGNQVYITLGAAINFLNKYIIAKGSDGQPLVRLSLKSNEYDGSPVTDLLCIAHPLQVSVDPGVCLIKSPIWSGGTVIQTAASGAAADPTRAKAQTIFNKLVAAGKGPATNEIQLLQAVQEIDSADTFNAIEELFKTSKTQYSNFASLLNGELDSASSISGQGSDLQLALSIQSHLKDKKVTINFKKTNKISIWWCRSCYS